MARTVNKAELVDEIASKADLTKVAAKDALEALLETITKALQLRNKVQITGFGSFEARKRKGRTGRNPRTGAAVYIAEKWTPAFKPGKVLKDEVASAQPSSVPGGDVSPPVTPPWGDSQA